MKGKIHAGAWPLSRSEIFAQDRGFRQLEWYSTVQMDTLSQAPHFLMQIFYLHTPMKSFLLWRSVSFDKCIELCNHHHNQVQDSSLTLKYSLSLLRLASFLRNSTFEFHPCCKARIYRRLFVHQLKDIWVASSFEWLWIKWLWICAYRFWGKYTFSFFSGQFLVVELLGHMGSVFNFIWKCLFYKMAVPFGVPASNVGEIPLICIPTSSF